MDQGTSVYRFEVRRNGSLVEDPELVRSSGFTDLDQAARQAIERCTPFSPLPPELAPQHPSIHITMAIEFSNPMVN
jgi:protein TonB